VKVTKTQALAFGILLIISLFSINAVRAQDHEHGHGEEAAGEYDPVGTVMHHIADANEFHVWKGIHIPLPCFLYAPDHGWTILSSGKFEHGHKAIDRYVLNHGRVNRIADPSFPMGEVHIEGVHGHKEKMMVKGKEKEVEVFYAEHEGKQFKLEKSSVPYHAAIRKTKARPPAASSPSLSLSSCSSATKWPSR
jgi:F-type H+-transporting ATPase subunit a